MKIFTIGTSGKKPDIFFDLLMKNNVKTVIDVRLKDGFTSGYARKAYLPYFLDTIAGIGYKEMKQCAPTEELMNALKNGEIPWMEFKKRYLKTIKEREILKDFSKKTANQACFLCAEAEPDRCHRKVLAEYLKKHFGGTEIVHL